MNFGALKNIKFDINALKNLSAQDVRNFINERQVVALNIVIVIGALIVGGFVVSTRLEEYAGMKVRMDELLAKEEPVLAYTKAVKKTSAFLKTIPLGLTEDSMISYLTEVASRHQVVINEFKPPLGVTESFYAEAKASFTCFVPGFYEAMAFINELETSEHLIKINAWSLVPKEKEQAKKQVKGQDSEGIRSSSGFLMNMDVSSIRLIENDERKQKKE